MDRSREELAERGNQNTATGRSGLEAISHRLAARFGPFDPLAGHARPYGRV